MDIFEETVRKEYEPIKESGATRVGFAKGFRGRQKVDPVILAAYKLGETLKKYPEFSKAERGNLQNEFEGFADLPVVNLETFASVLAFLKDYPNLTLMQFEDNIIVQYFGRLLPTKDISIEERKQLIIRLKAEFLKYIVAINTYRSRYNMGEENEERYESSQEENEESNKSQESEEESEKESEKESEEINE